MKSQLITKTLTTILLLLICKFNFAQTTSDTGKFAFSLKQCIEYGLENHISMKNAVLDEMIAKDKVKEVTGIGFPQISGSIGFQNNDPLRRMFGVGTGGYNFFTGQMEAEGHVFAVPNIFQLKAGGDASLSVSQIIFNSSYLVGLQAAKTYKELSTKVTEQTKIQLVEAITKAYYLILINQERIKLFDKNIARLDSLLFQTKALYKSGFIEKIDVDRLEVADNNLKTEREKFTALLELSNSLLKFQMQMPLKANLSLTEKISDFKVEANPDQNVDYKKRIEYSLLESQKRLQQLELRNFRLTYLPTIAAFANGGWFSQSPRFDYFKMNNLWYQYGVYGISMSIPIFDGGQTIYKTKQAKLKLQKIENDISSFKQVVDLQTQSSNITLNNNLITLKSQSKNMALAEEVAKVTKSKYKQGTGTSLEVITAETSLLEAQTNYLNALYDALISKIDYEKATGNLK